RHTSFSRDWSSDVCSSDLVANPGHGPFADQPGGAGPRPDAASGRPARLPAALDRRRGDLAVPRAVALELAHPLNAAARSRMIARAEERRVGEAWRCRWCAV